MTHHNEFSKLDYVDQQTAYWLKDHDPKELREWARYMENTYNRKNLKISGSELHAELLSFTIKQN